MIKSYKRECFTCFETFRKPVLGKVVTFPYPLSEGTVEVIWTLMLRLWVKRCRDEKMRHYILIRGTAIKVSYCSIMSFHHRVTQSLTEFYSFDFKLIKLCETLCPLW